MELLHKDTYLAMIRNAAGSKLFQTMYVFDQGEKKDILRGGDLSCAFFVSTILHHFRLINSPHATVRGTMADLEKNNWTKHPVQTPGFEQVKEGAVLIWEEKKQKGEAHVHIGFYIGDNDAVSNNPEGDTPFVHDVTFNNTRNIDSIYTHGFLK